MTDIQAHAARCLGGKHNDNNDDDDDDDDNKVQTQIILQ